MRDNPYTLQDLQTDARVRRMLGKATEAGEPPADEGGDVVVGTPNAEGALRLYAVYGVSVYGADAFAP